jgi:FMN phosphatase YigB (HAD superfamily)
MKIRAVVFDIYKTLVEVGPPPSDAEKRWQELKELSLAAAAPRIGLEQFASLCEQAIAREHAAARASGVPWPEVFWPDIAREALPELRSLGSGELDEFLYHHAQLQRTIRAAPGVGEVLATIKERGILAGVASNSQPYTLRELEAALRSIGYDHSCFHPELIFWSFTAGFSKPDPHVFRWLTRRLKLLGISPGETLMVGDRIDNDIRPAEQAGWQTWHLQSPPESTQGGNWEELNAFLRL